MKRRRLSDLWPLFGLMDASDRIRGEAELRDHLYSRKQLSLDDFNHGWLKDVAYLGALWTYNIGIGIAGAYGLMKILEE
jgi:hypothetical protein